MIIYSNLEFKNFNSLRVNNIIKHMFEVENSCEIYTLVYLFNKFNLNYHVIGNASKVLFKEQYVNTPVIYINDRFKEIYYMNNKVLVSAGTKLSYLINMLAKKGYGGFHNLFPIPACVGGAIYMNAGDNINDIAKFVDKVICIDKCNNNIVTFSNDQCNFSYRNSVFKNNKYVILYVLFKYELIDKNIIYKEIKNAIEYRKNNQIIKQYTCGSLFKNYDGIKAYKLIDKTISKNLNVNGARLSSKHLNFLINDGNATSEDMLLLIKSIYDELLFKYNIKLQLELNII